MYSFTSDRLYLEKAMALADTITRMQDPETGMIPTHWTSKTAIEDGGDLWINCLISTAAMMLEIAEATENN